MWFVYILKASDGTLYTGITTNIERRIKEHNSGGKLGSKYLRGKTPVAIVYFEEFENRSLATKREIEIKKMDRKDKLILILNFSMLQK